eukprot:6207302-Pleurochrysis_carterae.AAC.3
MGEAMHLPFIVDGTSCKQVKQLKMDASRNVTEDTVPNDPRVVASRMRFRPRPRGLLHLHIRLHALPTYLRHCAAHLCEHPSQLQRGHGVLEERLAALVAPATQVLSDVGAKHPPNRRIKLPAGMPKLVQDHAHAGGQVVGYVTRVQRVKVRTRARLDADDAAREEVVLLGNDGRSRLELCGWK